ncbi:MAG: 50S ribosomal protein L29 [Candidatus Pacebacteria bacterium]|nr:50S ribosomal protein L29 [Candidatus Paceibacterota bacterium]
MKKKQLEQLVQKTSKELTEMLKTKTKELVEIRNRMKSGKEKDLHRLSRERHNLARIKTILNKGKL